MANKENSNNAKTTIISPNLGWGTYMFQTESGKLFTDGNGNILSLDGEKGDLRCVEKMRTFAQYYGAGEGKVVFSEGRWKISDSEYEAQVGAMHEGRDPESIYGE